MVRSFWIGPPVIALALMASAWGQPAASPPTAAVKPAERIITVQDPGKPALRCRVLRAWELPGGGKAYQVQSLETGEMLTIVAGGSPTSPSSPGQPNARAASMTVYHWGRSATPPAGCPLPPASTTVQAPASPRVGPQRMPVGVAAVPPSPPRLVPPLPRPQPPVASPVVQAVQQPRPAVAPVVQRPMPARVSTAYGATLPAAAPVPSTAALPGGMTSLPFAQQTSPAETRDPVSGQLRTPYRNTQPTAPAVASAPPPPVAKPPVSHPLLGPSLPVAEPVTPADTRVSLPPTEEPRTVTDVPKRPILSRLLPGRKTAPREQFASEPGLIPAEPQPIVSAPMPVAPRVTLPAPDPLSRVPRSAVLPPPAPSAPMALPAPPPPTATAVVPPAPYYTPRSRTPYQSSSTAQAPTGEKPRPKGTYGAEPARPVTTQAMPMDPRATMPAPIQTSVTPVQATATSTPPPPPPPPAKASEGHAPVAEKMIPADTRVTLPPAHADQGCTTWAPAHCEEPPGPLGRMQSRKHAAWEDQRQQQEQLNQAKHGLLGKVTDGKDNCPTIIIPESPVMRPTLLERIFNHKKCDQCEGTVCEGTPVAPAKVEEKKAETKSMPKADLEPAKPVDNRQSWGKYEPLDPVLPGKTTRTTASTKSPDPLARVPRPDTTGAKPSATTPAKPIADLDLPHARPAKGGDPLTHPEGYGKFPSEPVTTIPEVKPPAPSKKDTGTRPVLPPPPPLNSSPLPPSPADGEPQAGKHPPGSASVIAAGETRYVPVPIMTVPAPRPALVPPTPPMPQVPEAPALNRMVNGGSAGGTPPSGMANAFTSPGPSRTIPSENTPSDLAVNAFSGPAPAESAPPSPSMPNRAMPTQAMAGGYPPVGPMPNPAMAGGYPPAPPGYAPAMPPPNVAMMPPPAFAAASYYNYAAPAPGAMTAPSAPGYSQAQQGAATMPSVAHILRMLRDSDFPSQREWAAEQLGGANGRSSPETVQALVTAAKGDEAPMVRVCCIRSLMKMQANTVPVVTAVQALKNDPDPRVRDAVGEALTAFGVAPAAPGTPSIQPVGR